MQKLRGALSGLRDSLVRSQAWRPEFVNALRTYPILDLTEFRSTVDSCEGCRLPDRQVSRLAVFSGEPYDEVTFEVSTPSKFESFFF